MYTGVYAGVQMTKAEVRRPGKTIRRRSGMFTELDVSCGILEAAYVITRRE